ncbi:MAG: glutathione S-transferase family protein [Alphaproteobacteria bacterium]|nr:MAG: glutathione S-transferase family protein [Alphaproteobacteria bacterium]
MRTLYHIWLSPFCRKVRFYMAEKSLPFELKVEKIWERRTEFFTLNPAGEVPVLVDQDGKAIVDANAICEYLEETYASPNLLGHDPHARAETRRLIAWFDGKFNREVSAYLVDEKMMKRFVGLGEPNSHAIRAGKANIGHHLDYISYLIERRNWLAGDQFTLADIAAAAHLSCIDYLGDVPWDNHPVAKQWYMRIKSRPAFRGLLADHIPGVPPPKHYAQLDF